MRYPRLVTTRADLQRFLKRPWAAQRAAKDQYNVRLASSDCADDALAVADALRRHAAQLGALSTEEARAVELLDLVRLKERIDLVSRRLARPR